MCEILKNVLWWSSSLRSPGFLPWIVAFGCFVYSFRQLLYKSPFTSSSHFIYKQISFSYIFFKMHHQRYIYVRRSTQIVKSVTGGTFDCHKNRKKECRKNPESRNMPLCTSISTDVSLFVRICSNVPHFVSKYNNWPLCSSGVPRNFVRGGVQIIQLRTEDIENGHLGAVAP